MADSLPVSCPDCGWPLATEAWAEGNCLGCLAELAQSEPPIEIEDLPLPAKAGRALAPGTVLGGRFQICSRLGCGGVGEVWRAFDLKLRVDVAIKSVRTERVADPEAAKSLYQEVRLAREVISPHVCRVFDLQSVDGREWITMEYIGGRSLAEILCRRGPLALDEADDLAAQFLAGVAAIHGAGILHRDIKPENLMVTRHGRVVVMDLGTAECLETGQSRCIAGTPAYMSPEQARGEALDERADVFSAGVVLAEMAAPTRLALADDRRRVWEGIHAEEPRIASSPWAGVIAQAVASDRERRPRSIEALAEALEEATRRSSIGG